MSFSGLGEWLLGEPLWLIAVVLVGAMFAASVAGRALRRVGHAKEKPSGDSQDGYIVSAVLGLEALLMGFTFALAVDRFDARRGLVLEEANAIGTVYLRTQLLEQPFRSEIGQLLIDYTENRIALGLASREDAPGMLARNDDLVRALWVATMGAFPSIRDLDFSSAYLDSMNAVIDLDASRKAARAAHVPAAVFVVLFIYVIVSAGVLGFEMKSRNGHIAANFLFLLFALSLILIIDIDRPTSGGVNESQEPMLRLRESMMQPYP